jgi:hypothetical protein
MKLKNKNGGMSAAKTETRPLPAKATELLDDRVHGLPIWIRSPKNGTEYYGGLSRAKLYELNAEGKIRSVSIRKPGQVKGTRLFNLKSILDFIESFDSDPRLQFQLRVQKRFRRFGRPHGHQNGHQFSNP